MAIAEHPAGSSLAAEPATAPLRFFVGVHQTRFLWWMDVPMMVSRRTLDRYPPRKPAAAPWALDSGGFTELSLHGTWLLGAGAYARQAQEYSAVLGRPDFCAPQDWMCEPLMLRKTGLSVAEHQRRTVRNYLLLRTLAPALPWMPVLQGWTLADYESCAEQYAVAGVDLQASERVGLGTLCRRQSSDEAATIVRRMHARGLRLHGFGVKVAGLARVAPLLVSADSHAWNYWPTYRTRVPDCCGHYAYCSNCWHYAQRWHGQVVAGLAGPPERYAYQLSLDWSGDHGG